MFALFLPRVIIIVVVKCIILSSIGPERNKYAIEHKEAEDWFLSIRSMPGLRLIAL